MKYSYFLIFLSLFFSVDATILGDRTANPSYIRILKTYDHPSVSTQHAPAHALVTTPGSMRIRPITQPSDTEQQTQQPINQTDESMLSAREKEIAGFSHMYGTSDIYGDIELK